MLRRLHDRIDEPERLRNVAHALDGRGVFEVDIARILGGNWLRFFPDIFGG